MNVPLWEPSSERLEQAQLTAFRTMVNQRWGLTLADYDALYRWSITDLTAFWNSVWDFCGVIASQRGNTVVTNTDDILTARWFPEARLNFAENLLRHRDSRIAIIFRDEYGQGRQLSAAELYNQVSQLAQALAAAGVVAGDRVAGYLPNVPETVIGMLAASSLGAIWTACSPDFGTQGILDRLGQITPKVLIATDGYVYNGRLQSRLDTLAALLPQLPSVQQTIIVPFLGEPLAALMALGPIFKWADCLARFSPTTIEFAQLPFDHPLYIMFSSGTTGIPKCIVHGAGGTLLQHLKEHRLHTNIQAGDRVFYFTTCSWMMWQWLVSALASEACIMLYEGSPFHPETGVLWKFAAQEGASVFGTSAKYLDTLAKREYQPGKRHDLSALKVLLSTGSPLMPESFDYVYQHIKTDLQLSSISGGTDIVSCFALGAPTLPVWRGELQCLGLGMAVQVYDENGQAVTEQKGELVCVKPFPSRPIYFWHDPDQTVYKATYFARFPPIWCHGDYVALTEHQGLVIYGRSDAVLNPSGIRIGTAEIYRQVEQFDEVLESLVIGQTWQRDIRIVLFVRLREGQQLTDELQDRLRQYIRQQTTPHHVPAKIIQVNDIPRTKSGKLVELAVRKMVHGEVVKNQEALANPEALDEYANLAALQEA